MRKDSRKDVIRATTQAPGLRGSDRAATILLLVGKELAGRIVKKLGDEEIRVLARAASALPELSLAHITEIAEELAHRLQADVPLKGSHERAREFLSEALGPDELGELMAELTGAPSDAIWAKLNAISPKRIAETLQSERPQVAAYALSQLTPEKASAVLEQLEPDLQKELGRRLVTARPISDDARKIAIDSIARSLINQKGGEQRAAHAMLGAILNELDKTRSEPIIADMEQTHPKDAEIVRKFMFSFDDVGLLAEQDRKKLLDEVPADILAMALRDAAADLTAKILAAISPRQKRIVEAELSSPAAIQSAGVAKARRAIASRALSLMAAGTIAVPHERREANKANVV